MFYTIATIIKFMDERKAARNAAAVRAVSSNDDLMAQAIRENPTLAAQVLEQLEREPIETGK